jgi:hypothetical protein
LGTVTFSAVVAGVTATPEGPTCAIPLDVRGPNNFNGTFLLNQTWLPGLGLPPVACGASVTLPTLNVVVALGLTYESGPDLTYAYLWISPFSTGTGAPRVWRITLSGRPNCKSSTLGTLHFGLADLQTPPEPLDCCDFSAATIDVTSLWAG